MKYKLVKFPDERLYKPTQEVTSYNESLHELLDSMKIIMEENNGKGLSSNQVGADLSVFIMKDGKNEILEMINPKILETQQIQLLNEGCLSAPDVFLRIPRPKYVTLEYRDRYGERKEAMAHDLEAVCIVHEMEHLMGKAFYEHGSRQVRRAIYRKLGIK